MGRLVAPLQMATAFICGVRSSHPMVAIRVLVYFQPDCSVGMNPKYLLQWE